MTKGELVLREEIVWRCRELNASGVNQGTSGNISGRLENRMLISPSAIPYGDLTPELIASMPLDGDGAWEGPAKPSSEWRMHYALLRARPDAQAVVHAHPAFCTALAIAGKEIPACHYMIAAFGGNSVRCAGYATFGTQDLSDLALQALTDRTACLLANHGMLALGDSLAKAMWRTVELEALARQYYLSLQLGGPVLLSKAQIDETLARFAGYGLRSEPAAPTATVRGATREAPVKKARGEAS